MQESIHYQRILLSALAIIRSAVASLQSNFLLLGAKCCSNCRKQRVYIERRLETGGP